MLKICQFFLTSPRSSVNFILFQLFLKHILIRLASLKLSVLPKPRHIVLLSHTLFFPCFLDVFIEKVS